MRLFRFFYYTLSLFLSIFLLSAGAHAQGVDNTMDYNKSSSASGSTSFMNAAASVSPSLYTGGLQVNLPIYSLKSSSITIPIQISYTASNGVRPTDPNTCVGMDWMLTAGGSITRTVRGLPDDGTNGYVGPSPEGATVASDYTSSTWSTVQTHNDTYLKSASHSPTDGEPDLFTITTPSFSAQFTLDQYGNPIFNGGNTGLKVLNQLDGNSSPLHTESFVVIDAQGNKYYFGSTDASREWTTTSFFGSSTQFISTWYLDGIVLMNSQDVISLTYQTFVDEEQYTYELYKTFNASVPSASWPPVPGTTLSGYSNVDVMNVMRGTYTYNSPKQVSTIVTKEGEADFAYNYNSYSYVNLSTPPSLGSITIKQFDPITAANDITLQTYNFTYTDLFTGLIPGASTPQPAGEACWLFYRRLLNTITVTGNTSTTSTPITLYNLYYYESLPACSREDVQAWDYWGYQNNTFLEDDPSNSDESYFIFPDATRQPNAFQPSGQPPIPMALNLGLQELDQLGGSKTIFNFQQNDYFNGSANVAAGGARISSIVREMPTGETLTTSYNYYDASGHSTGQICNDLYRHVLFFNGNCCDPPAVSYSQSPYELSDDNGVTVGYTSVTKTDPNGGYTVSTFSNFSDYPDVFALEPTPVIPTLTYNPGTCSNISSFSYKRGLPLTQTLHTAAGTIVSSDANTYGPAHSNDPAPTVDDIGMQDMTLYTTSPVFYGVNIYHQNIQNWRLLQTVHTSYDQQTTGRYMQQTTSYTYAPDGRKVRMMSTTDSKGQTHSLTNYYVDDQSSIPMVTSTELSTLSAMAGSAVNAIDLVTHQVESRNGITHQYHSTYSTVNVNNVNDYLLTTTSSYVGGTAGLQQFNSYSPANAQVISSSMTAGKPISYVYGYNNVFPIVKIENAATAASYAEGNGTLAGSTEVIPGFLAAPLAVFTTTATGPITVTMGLGSWFGSGQSASLSFALTGTSGGTLTNSSNSMTFSNMPPGTYALNVIVQSNTATTTFPVTYTYPGSYTYPTGYGECFFEGFEQSSGNTAGTAHSGNYYSNGNYTVPFSPPNGRQYLIQWWNLSGGKWIFNQSNYTANMSLTGPVDDVRVFPSDALMTTYTYSPLLGKTSETDPTGRTVTFEYDGLGRLLHVRDQDGNLLRQYDYEYQVGLQQ